MIRKNYIPGNQGTKAGKRRSSEYALHLREKQKLRRVYNVLERQFRRYYSQASKKRGVTGDFLFQILESRLDNVVYRANFASSRTQARQLLNHGFFLVNNKKVNIPSYQAQAKDKIALAARAEKSKYFKALQLPPKETCAWLEVDRKKREIQVLRKPVTADVDQAIDMALIVEYYSR